VTTRTRPLVLLAGTATALVAVLSGCALGADPVAGSDSRALGPTSSARPASTATGSGSPEVDRVVQPEDPACAPGEGKQVEQLDDVVIPAISVEEQVVPDEQVGDVTIPGFTVPGYEIPETVVEAGCVIRHEAPGACLGGVEIVGVELPPVRLPDAEVPPVVVDGETLYEGERVEGGSASGSAAEGDSVEQTCQEEPAETGDDFVSAVFRGAIFREALFREALFRSAVFRPRLCLDVDGREECAPSVAVPSRSIPSVAVPSQSVASASLPSYVVEGAPDTTVYTGESEQAYVTPAEVLFDFDESVVKPAAAASLTAIAARIPAGAAVAVEGHTDDQGSDAYNRTLSEDRAAAVAAWLTANAGVPAASISTEGLGETAPAASNADEAGRAQNRRVVITVTAP
jgi:outer membrane protein OmpA-like peptidoglycan-associated protein